MAIQPAAYAIVGSSRSFLERLFHLAVPEAECGLSTLLCFANADVARRRAVVCTLPLIHQG
jgi:hypothetical protein